MKRHAIARSALIVALIIAGMTLTAVPPAEAGHGRCDLENACIYNSSNRVIYHNVGNTGTISIAAGGGKVWNHGVRYPGADHIQLRTRTASGARWTICLHYGPQKTSNPDRTVATLITGEVVTGWTWRGECGSGEDNWKQY